jgi:hypothetical protein
MSATMPKYINIAAVCPHCGESLEIVLTKKEVKTMFKNFKKPIPVAQKGVDTFLEKRLNEEAKQKGWLR